MKNVLVCLLVSQCVILTAGLSAQEVVYTPYQPGLSLDDQAMERFMEKDYTGAVELMVKWLAADPDDIDAWYNLACAYALSGQQEKALDAFDRSIDCGYRDNGHAMNDADLESIREHTRFKAALERAKEQANGPVDFKRHILSMERFGTYIVALPPDYETSERDYPVCLILHGHGSTELNHGELADVLGRNDVIFVCPRAPYPFTPLMIHGGRESYTAWSQIQMEEGAYPKGSLESQYIKWIFACADDAMDRYRCRTGKFFIFGHSQGAGFANMCALTHPERVESYFSYAGYLNDLFKDVKYFKRLRKNGVTPYLVHCKEDPVVAFARSEELADYMKQAKVDYSLQEFKGDHGFSEDVYQAARDWLDKEVRGQKDKK
jgi:predicted esterase